ncbi:hypothetical protein [Mycobacterium kyogaense]|uniref:hypothetical protein n=1 Tax=Mycobacterium kyogaense TaxID=2212479 RepID=UPI0013C48141|nr:hypothetical protein [Mycobacterium kyogaense]
MKTRVPLGTLARSNTRCPESGVWESQDYPSTTAPIAEHNNMPLHRGVIVNWKLIQYA